jgi:hypothetical protein
MKRHLTIVRTGVPILFVSSILAGLILKSHGAVVQVTMALSAMAASFNIFAVPFFLVGVKQFKAELQRAYIILCIGIGIFGLAQVQLPLVSLFNWNFWLNSGGVALPYLLGVIGIFWGMRVLATLLHIKSLWTSSLVALIAATAVSFGASFLPHVKVTSDELSFHLALALSIWNSVFITFAAVTAFQIRGRIGTTYIQSINWLCAALTAISFAGWHYALIQLTMTTGYWYYDYSFTIIPFVVGAGLFIMAGYAFDSIDILSTTDSAPAAPAGTYQSDNPTSPELDIVLYVASLVSNPADIDTVLDNVRIITSRLQPGQALPAEDQRTLAIVYRKIENYLVSSDPLRAFSQDELRQGIMKKFGIAGGSQIALWREN